MDAINMTLCWTGVGYSPWLDGVINDFNLKRVDWLEYQILKEQQLNFRF